MIPGRYELTMYRGDTHRWMVVRGVTTHQDGARTT